MASAVSKTNGRKRINLALQGGGSHGAFTWGVLAKLMSDRRIFIDGMSGTSAGAMNAVVFTDGFIKGGRQGAIDALAKFWKRVSGSALLPTSALRGGFQKAGDWNIDDTPGFHMIDVIMRMFSPYSLNPFDLNPLRDIMADSVDFARLRKHREFKLFVAATNVRTCKVKVFHTHELSAEALMASACLPMLFRAVEIDGESYWDGGYLANPAISPLLQNCISKDIVIVQINPMVRPDVPTTARGILNRINEISFNSSLVREMNGLATVSRLSQQHEGMPDYKPVNFHMIHAEAEMSHMGSASKFNADWDFLRHLHELGMRTAGDWLDENFDHLGTTSTLDLLKTYE